MKPLKFSIEQLNQSRISQSDLVQISMCRRYHNRLGFGYQLSFVKLLNRFPIQVPFEVIDDILNYVSVQLSIPADSIRSYMQRRETITEHQERIRRYLGLERFDDAIVPAVKEFLFKEAGRLEQTTALMAKTEQFLKERKILRPADYTLQRIIGKQRKAAREYIFKKIVSSLSPEMQKSLDSLLETKEIRVSDFQIIKQPPGKPSPAAILRLVDKLKMFRDAGVLEIDLAWLSNNFQRSLARYSKRCDAHKMSELEPKHRYSALACFLVQSHRDTMDFMVDMYDKLINRIYNHAQEDIDNHNKSKRKQLRASLMTFKTITPADIQP